MWADLAGSTTLTVGLALTRTSDREQIQEPRPSQRAQPVRPNGTDAATAAHMAIDAQVVSSRMFTIVGITTIHADPAGAGWADAFGAEDQQSA